MKNQKNTDNQKKLEKLENTEKQQNAAKQKNRDENLKIAAVVHGGTIMAVCSSFTDGEYFDFQIGNRRRLPLQSNHRAVIRGDIYG